MTVTLERLDPERDELLVREAVAWLDSAPRWFRDCDAAWGAEGADAYLKQMRDEPQADFGVFVSGQLVAVITVSLCGKGVYNSHLMARRGANPEAIVACIKALMGGLFEEGMKESWNWVASRNVGVRRVLEATGMVRDGVERFKGQSHGRPILWVRYSVRATV
jgi:hypothetical protein